MRRLLLPRTLRLRGALYRVVVCDELRGRGLDGHFDEKTRTIRIAADLDDRAREETLLHEILHGVHPGDGGDHEEAVVDAMAAPLLEVLRQLRWTR